MLKYTGKFRGSVTFKKKPKTTYISRRLFICNITRKYKHYCISSSTEPSSTGSTREPSSNGCFLTVIHSRQAATPLGLAVDPVHNLVCTFMCQKQTRSIVAFASCCTTTVPCYVLIIKKIMQIQTAASCLISTKTSTRKLDHLRLVINNIFSLTHVLLLHVHSDGWLLCLIPLPSVPRKQYCMQCEKRRIAYSFPQLGEHDRSFAAGGRQQMPL